MVGPKMDLSAWLRKQLEESDPDLRAASCTRSPTPS